ncbi:hypothetical protein Ac2012v2_005097 [Leucoagaricus gongylophorus]
MYKHWHRYTTLGLFNDFIISRNLTHPNPRANRADSNAALWVHLSGTCQPSHAPGSPKIFRRDRVPVCLR